MRVIALEEHFATPAFMEGPGRKLKERAETSGGRLARVVAELTDLGDGRVAAMDAAGVDVQALSLTEPGVQRVDVMSPAMTRLKKPISAYLRENVHYTFSGFNFLPTFLDLMLKVGVDRIMFSTDHPYQSMARRTVRASRALSSTAIIAAGIWTTASSGRFSRA